MRKTALLEALGNLKGDPEIMIGVGIKGDIASGGEELHFFEIGGVQLIPKAPKGEAAISCKNFIELSINQPERRDEPSQRPGDESKSPN